MAESPERAFGMQLKGREVFPAVPPFFVLHYGFLTCFYKHTHKALPHNGRLTSPLLAFKKNLPLPVGGDSFFSFGFEAHRVFFTKALPSGFHRSALALGNLLCYFSRLKRL